MLLCIGAVWSRMLRVRGVRDRQVAQQRRLRHPVQHLVVKLDHGHAVGRGLVFPGRCHQRGPASHQRAERRGGAQCQTARHQVNRSAHGGAAGSSGQAGVRRVDGFLYFEPLLWRLRRRAAGNLQQALQARQLRRGLRLGARQLFHDGVHGGALGPLVDVTLGVQHIA